MTPIVTVLILLKLYNIGYIFVFSTTAFGIYLARDGDKALDFVASHTPSFYLFFALVRELLETPPIALWTDSFSDFASQVYQDNKLYLIQFMIRSLDRLGEPGKVIACQLKRSYDFRDGTIRPRTGERKTKELNWSVMCFVLPSIWQFLSI